ncbi:MAG: hypothetical protein ACJAT2_000248 [Bacteriovoracaceae bacterium]|jgi:hypothetical protein
MNPRAYFLALSLLKYRKCKIHTGMSSNKKVIFIKNIKNAQRRPAKNEALFAFENKTK